MKIYNLFNNEKSLFTFHKILFQNYVLLVRIRTEQIG